MQSFLFTLIYGENTHVLLEDRKSLERPATLEKIRSEQAAAASAPPTQPNDDDVIILDATGQEPGAVLPMPTHTPIPLHFRTTFISLKPPAIFEQFLGQVKSKWAPRPSTAMVDGMTCAIGTDWIVRIGYVVQGTAHKGIVMEASFFFIRSRGWDIDNMVQAEYLPLQVFPAPADGKPPAILAEFIASIIPQTHAVFSFFTPKHTEEQWSDILGPSDETLNPAEPASQTDSVHSYGFEHATPLLSDWGSGFAQERRSAFLLLRMLLDERLLN